jgi:hypothetical protein
VERFHSPIAEGRKPAGKGLSTLLTAVIRPRLPGRARNAPARGRQARPDLTPVKSGKEEGGTVFDLIPSRINLFEGLDQQERQLRQQCCRRKPLQVAEGRTRAIA